MCDNVYKESPCFLYHFTIQIPKFIMNQVRRQNMESQRKQNKERAVRKLLKKITADRPPDKAVPEVVAFISWYTTVSDPVSVNNCPEGVSVHSFNSRQLIVETTKSNNNNMILSHPGHIPRDD